MGLSLQNRTKPKKSLAPSNCCRHDPSQTQPAERVPHRASLRSYEDTAPLHACHDEFGMIFIQQNQGDFINNNCGFRFQSYRLDHVGSIILQIGSDWRFDSIPRTGKKHNWRSITTPHAGPYTSANQDGIQKNAMSKGTTSSRLPDLFLHLCSSNGVSKDIL